MPRGVPNSAPPKSATAVASISAKEQEDSLFNGIEGYELQRAVIQRVAKSGVPPQVKLSKDVFTALNKCSTVFISYLAATAHEASVGRGVKTISPNDVISAITMADFFPPELLPHLESELTAFRKLAEERKAGKAEGEASSVALGSNGKRKEKAASGGDAMEVDEDEDDEDVEDEADVEDEDVDEEEDVPEPPANGHNGNEDVAQDKGTTDAPLS